MTEKDSDSDSVEGKIFNSSYDFRRRNEGAIKKLDELIDSKRAVSNGIELLFEMQKSVEAIMTFLCVKSEIALARNFGISTECGLDVSDFQRLLNVQPLTYNENV